MDKEFSKYKEKIEKSLIKKALGYQYKEIIEEYSIGEDGEKLSKKKITTKDVPPDISAVKLLLDSLNVATSDNFENMSDDELRQEIKNAMELIERIKVKCDFVGCGNLADYSINLKRGIFGGTTDICTACLHELYTLCGKEIVPQSPPNILRKKEIENNAK